MLRNAAELEGKQKLLMRLMLFGAHGLKAQVRVMRDAGRSALFKKFSTV